ncbi:TolC family protein [Spirosoma rigui]|uniref:TolC family protein n=1 Tax=Spirosoma rigui TaxID=564064 RepID=UPI0009AF731A|nr:TolC family protein [Spirosoma rigui]
MKTITASASLVGLLLATTTWSQPAPPVGTVPTRQALIEQALTKSYALANNQAEQRKVQIEKQGLKNQYLPEVTFNPTYTHLDRDISITLPRLPYQPLPKEVYSGPYELEQQLQPQNIMKATVQANMLLFSGTKIPTLNKALTFKEQAVRALADKERMAIIRDVALAYDQLGLISQSEQVLDEADKRLAEQVRFINKAVKEGLATPYDRSKVELAVQDLQAKRVDLNGKRQLALARLTQLTGVPAEQLAGIRPELTRLVADMNVASVENRPELKSLELAREATRYRQKATLSGYLPQVYAFGKNELYRKDLSAIEPYWYAGVGVRWTLFDKFTSRTERRTAQQDLEMAQNTMNQTRDLLTLNLQKSQSEMTTANQLADVAQQKAVLARKALDIATRQYEQGLIRITERLEAETDYQKAELDYVQTIANQRAAQVAQLEAVGTLTSTDIN